MRAAARSIAWSRSRRATPISIYDVFDDVIARLEPTHILTQIQCEVCAVSLRDVEAALARGMKGQPQIVSLQPDSLAEIWDDIRRVARALGDRRARRSAGRRAASAHGRAAPLAAAGRAHASPASNGWSR